MKGERPAHALFLLATCLALGVGVVGSAAWTSPSYPSARGANNVRWSLLAQVSKKTACSCRTNASAGWSKSSGVRVRGGAVVSDQYNARMQVMITRNMRKVLVDELDYLPDEVDDMDPQIAAVVIEKSLPRPRAGMPIAWRRSIRQTGSSGPPNPFRYLTDAIQVALEGVVNGAVALLAFPFVVAGRAAGAVRRGGVTGVAAAALVLGLVAALVTSDSETAPGEEDAHDLSPRAAGPQGLGANLAAARTMLLSRGRAAGEADDARSGETPPTGKETRGRGGGGGGGGNGDGGLKKAAGARKAGERRVDTKERKASKGGEEKLIRDEAGFSNSGGGGGGGGGGRRRNADRQLRDSSPRSYDRDGDDDRGRGSDDVDEDDWRYLAGRDERGGGSLGSKSKKTQTKRLSAQQPFSEQRDADDFGRQERAGVSRKKQAWEGFGTTGGEVSRERSSATAATAKRASGTGRGMVGAGDGDCDVGGEARSQRPKKTERKRRRREEVDNEEVCPDAPVSPNAGGAVWFEDLPPAPPAPDTIGVLDEEEEEGLLGLGADQERRPRWGRKPMSEHIPSEEEMETWDSKIEASDTWLDRGINKAIGSLFGGQGEEEDTEK